jgi:hypothetical protein
MAEYQGVFEGRYPDKKGRIRLVSHFGELGYENRTQMKAASRILIAIIIPANINAKPLPSDTRFSCL